MHFFCLLLKESVSNDVINVCWTSLLRTTPSTSGGVVCRPVSTLKADILNITYDCYSQNNNVEIAAL